MNINQLTSFVQAAELGSLSKAASSLFTVQSAISRQMKALEEELQTQLFIRHGRGLKLTETGHQLFSRATYILKEIEDTKAEIISNNTVTRGRVTIGLPVAVASLLVATLIKRLDEEHPLISLHFVDAFSETLTTRLHKKEVNCAVLYDNQKLNGLNTYPLLEQDLYLVMHPNNPLAKCTSISFKQLENVPLTLPSQPHSLRMLLDNAAKKEHIKLNVTIDADSLLLRKDLVKSNTASTIISKSSIYNEIKDGSLKVAYLTEPKMTRKLFLAMPTDRPCTNATLKVSEILKQEIKKLVDSGLWDATLLM